MKKLLFYSNLMLLLLGISAFASGQYTGSNPNVAAFKLVVASDSTGGFEPAKAVDTLLTTHAAIPGSAPAWVQINLGAYFLIDGFGVVMLNAGELSSAYTFEVSEDGTTWVNLGSYGVAATGTFSYNLVHANPVQFVRINMSAKDDPASFTEIRVYGEQILVPPTPLCKVASNVGTSSFTANWFERPTATGYRLDVAYDIDFTNYVSGYFNLYTGDVLFKEVTGLDPGDTYYYRIRAYNIAGTSANSNRIEVVTMKAAQTISFDLIPDKTYGEPSFSLNATASSGLTLSYMSSDETVATVTGNQITLTGAGQTTISAMQDGNSQYNAAIPVEQTLLVDPRLLTVAGAEGADKVYDATVSATISGASLTGVVGSDVVSLANADLGTFASSVAGTNISINTSMSLTGVDAGNYIIEQPVGLEADILPKTLTLTGSTVANKIYDGQPDAVINPGTLNGVIGLDEVGITSPAAGSFAQSAAGTGIAVTTSLSLEGADAGNYSLDQPLGLSADITPKELTVLAQANDKVYDGTAAATLNSANLQGLVGSDAVNLENAGTGLFEQVDAGASIPISTSMNIAGPDTGNYTLLQPDDLSANITPKELTAKAEDNLREECAANPVFAVTYSGFVEGEDKSVLDTEPAGQSTANESTAPGAYEIILSGGADNNYSFLYENGTLTVFPDQTDPVLTVQDITVMVQSGSSAGISPADVVTQADDNCTLADTTLSQSTFTTDDIGDINVDVSLSDERGNTTTARAVITVKQSTGIEDQSGLSISFYPNPVENRLTVKSGQYGPLTLEITSLNGEVQLRKELEGESNELDLSMLDPGVYFVSCKSSQGRIVRKIVKL